MSSPTLPDAAVDCAPPTPEHLMNAVYEDLRRIAAHRLAHEGREHTLQPTALVHEAWLKLTVNPDRSWRGREHFLAAATEAMRRILVDQARRRHAAKRGANPERIPLETLELAAPSPDDRSLALGDALAKLAARDHRKAELVSLRYLTGCTFEEAASTLGIAVPTAKQWWAYARAWLKVELSD